MTVFAGITNAEMGLATCMPCVAGAVVLLALFTLAVFLANRPKPPSKQEQTEKTDDD